MVIIVNETKHMKNKKIIQALFIPIALLVVSGTCKAQNFTKEINSLYDHGTSIIRTINNANWLVYSDNDKGHLFYWIPMSGTNIDYLYLFDQNISIHDFEIFSDTVYFCGVKTEGEERCGVMGHFPIEGFPGGPVKYDLFPEVQSFDAMDVFSVGGHMHVVMTATVTDDGGGTMSDVRHISGDSWEHNLVVSPYKWYFDDVAVTTQHIVFTSRSTYMQKSNSRLWIIDRPLFFGSSIFMSTIYVNEFDNTLVCDKFLVTQSMGAWFVTAEEVRNNKIRMHQYSLSNYHSSVLFNGVPEMTLKALDYADYPNFADVLTTSRNDEVVDSRIYHVPAIAFEQGTTSEIHLYKNEDINSLNVASQFDSTFVASGLNTIDPYLRVFRYKYDKYTCSNREFFEIETNSYEYKVPEPEIFVQNYPHDIKLKSHSSDNVNIVTLCGAQ